MNRLADIQGISPHLNRQRNLTNHVTRMRADHAATQDLAVAMGFGAVVKQQLGSGFVAAVRNGSGLESGAGQLFVALQFTGNHFCGHMRFVHCLVRQHGSADDVANGEDVRHVGAQLDVDVDEARVRHGHASLVGGNPLLGVRPKACITRSCIYYSRRYDVYIHLFIL